MKVLIAEDNRTQRLCLRADLRRLGHDVVEAEDGEAALALFEQELPDVVITDWLMPKLSGLDLVRAIRGLASVGYTYVLLVTVQNKKENLPEAKTAGVDDFLTKPYEFEELDFRLQVAHRFMSRIQQAHRSEERARGGEPALEPIGPSKAFQQVLRRAEQVAREPASVLLTGEPGTGKELLARYLHDQSRRTGLFVPVNCAAFPDHLLESEFFGHEKGAFTGADRRKFGLFELAGKGTLFLDEVGDLSPKAQAVLLRVLQERKVRRVGGDRETPVDVRVVSASNTVEQYRTEGKFREDLYGRLEEFVIHVPPLRERPEDVEALVAAFVRNHALPVPSSDALDLLRQFPWTGNVRELNSALNEARIQAMGAAIGPQHLPAKMTKGRPGAFGSPPSSPTTESPSSDPLARENLLAIFDRVLGSVWAKGPDVLPLDGLLKALEHEVLQEVEKGKESRSKKGARLGLTKDKYDHRTRHLRE